MNLTASLLTWYDAHKRKLPWREAPDPYTAWVSETMAQQTRISQLLPFYHAFMARFPTVEALAASDLEAVLTVWAGMGYYARARNLHAAARRIARDGWPVTRAEWQKLPGVGPYTAAAVAAIVYGERTAAVDGNALRVYARLADDVTDISTPAARKAAEVFWEAAMPEDAAGIRAFTQAVMELGALVCVPANPLCESGCPLQALCLAHAHGTARRLPVKKAKKPSPVLPMTVLLITDPGGRVLTQRRETGLVKGLWVYCLCEGAVDPAAYARAMGFTVLRAAFIGHARHVFTHRVWEMDGYALYVAETDAPEGWRFMTPEEIKSAPFPAAVKYFNKGACV